MKKKTVISKEAEVLLKLLRIALGTEPRKYFGDVVEPFPEGIDWKEVIKLSFRHKVSALALDGLKASGYDPYEGLDEKQSEELKAILDPWYASVQSTEWNYCYYVDVLESLCKVFVDNGLTPIILKGYGLSLLYPRPSHRGIGDIDIFLVDKDGKPAAERGDEIIKEKYGIVSIKPEKDKEHHSQYLFRGITIENHYEVVSTFFNSKKDVFLRETLENLLIKGYRAIEGSDIFIPSPEYNAVALIQHMFAHFYFEKINLRQVCDYMVFLKKYGDDINWKQVNDILLKSELLDFSGGINSIIKKDLNFSLAAVNEVNMNTIIDSYILSDMLDVNMSHGIKNFGRYYRERWKYNYIYGKHWLKLTISSSIYHIIQACMKLF